MEPKASNAEVSEAELKLGIKLPEQYVEFIQNIGAGYFCFTNIISVNPNGERYLLDLLKQFTFPENFIPVSDDETGGYYGFSLTGGTCSTYVYYWHSNDDTGPELKYKSFYGYLVKNALKK